MNNSNIIPFQFNTSTVRVIIDDAGEIWFIAKDVATVLEYSDAEAMTRKLDTDEIQNLQIVGFGNRGVNVINESGLYNAVLSSRKESAKVFKKWVTSEVLPSVRKTGSYGPALSSTVDPRKLKTTFTSFHAIAKICGLKGNQAVLCADKATKNLEGHSPVQLLGIELKSEYTEVLLTPRDIGAQLGVSAHAANLRLKLNGFVEDIRDAKNRLLWQPTEKGLPYAEMQDANKAHSDGTPIQQLKWKSSIIPLLGESAA